MSGRTATSPQKDAGLFGKPLGPNDEGAPEFLVAVHHFLVQNGRGPSLFKGAKDAAEVADIRKHCNAGNFHFEGRDPAAVADVMKAYLAELGDHILANEYDKFLKTASAEPIQQLEVSRFVSRLPTGHQAALAYVVHMLHVLVSNQQNDLTAESVASAIAPSLLPARQEAHAAQWLKLTRFFIEKFEYLFSTIFECAQISESFAPAATPSVKKIGMEVRSSNTPSPNGSNIASPLGHSTSPPSGSGSPPPLSTSTPPPTLNVEDATNQQVPTAVLSPTSAGKVPPPLPEKTSAAVLAARRLSARYPPGQAPPLNTIGSSPLRSALSMSNEEDIPTDTHNATNSTTATAPANRAGGAASPTTHLDMVDALTKMASSNSLTAPVMLSSRNSFMVDADSAIRESEMHSARLRALKASSEAEAQKAAGVTILPVEGFRIEAPSTTFTLEQQKPFTVIDQEKYFRHYQLFFVGKDHVNYLTPKEEGPDGLIGPAVISVVSDDNSHMTKVLVRTTAGYELLALPLKVKKASDLAKALKATHPALQHANFRESKDKAGIESEVTKALLKYEQQNIQPNLKWGVLYRKPGQTYEDDMFANNNPSPAFEEFLNLLGDRITLKGWTGYKGGLDVKENNTGTHSVHTKFMDFEIMFHVAPLLPFYPNDKQQLERKRHLGNDIVVIIFQDVEEPFSPAWLKSEFNHIFVIITPVDDGKKYKVAIAYKEAVPRCGPFLPNPPILVKNEEFRSFILTKLTNAERVALYAPAFADKLVRSRGILLQQISCSYNPKPQGTFRGLPSNMTRTNLKEGMGGLLNRIGLSSSTEDPKENVKSDPARSQSPMLERKKSGRDLQAGAITKAGSGRELSPGRDRSAEPPRNRSGSTTAAPAEVLSSGPSAGRAASPLPATSPTTSSPLSSSPGVPSGPVSSPPSSVPSVTTTIASPRVASPRPQYDIVWEEQVRSANEELAHLSKLKFDFKNVLSEVRVEISYLLEQRLGADNNKLQDDAVATISLCANGREIISKTEQEMRDVWLVQAVPDPNKIISVDSGLYKTAVKDANAFLDFLTEHSTAVSNESESSGAARHLKSIGLVLEIFKKYRAKLQLTAEEKKLLELKSVIEQSIRDTQYRIIGLQIMLRKLEAEPTPSAALLKDISPQLKISPETPVSSIEIIRKLHQFELEQVNVHTVAKAIDTAHFIRGMNAQLAKLQDNRPAPLYTELTEEDATLALDRCAKQIDKLQEELAKPQLAQQIQDLNHVIRAVKSFLRGTELLPVTPERPHKHVIGSAAMDAADLADLKDVASFGLKEIQSNLQSYALSTMSHVRETVSPDGLSFIQYCLHIEEFVKAYFALSQSSRGRPALLSSAPLMGAQGPQGLFARPTAIKPPGPAIKLNNSSTAVASLSSPSPAASTPATSSTTAGSTSSFSAALQHPQPHSVTMPASTLAPSKPQLQRTVTQMMTAAEKLDPADQQKREQLCLAIARSVGEIRELLTLLESQILDSTSLEEPSALARVSLLLKKICNNQPTRVDELVRRPSNLKAVPADLAPKIQLIKTTVMTTFLETKDFLNHSLSRLDSTPSPDMNEAMAIGRQITSLRKVVRTYAGLDA